MFGSPLSSPGHDDNDDDEGGGCLSSHYFNLLLQEDNDNADDVDKDKDDVCDVDFIYGHHLSACVCKNCPVWPHQE